MAESDAESQTSQVSLSQGFEPQDDDAETLWEVIEITGEKPKYYKVRWSGTDPATLKPWAQSWVPKKDCTDDLVLEWKKKQKDKQRRKSTSSKGGRESAMSGKTAKDLVSKTKASTSNSRRSTSTIPTTKSNDAKATSKRGGMIGTNSRSTATVTPTGKKLKRETHAIEEEPNESEDNGDTPVPKSSSANANGKGKKRKIAEADSAHNSANVPKAKALDQEGDGDRKKLSDAPPKKRRKIEVEVVKSEPEAEDQPLLSQLGDSFAEDEESHPIRVVSGKMVQDEEGNSKDEDMDEERMVEDALSEKFDSSPPPPPPPAQVERTTPADVEMDNEGKSEAERPDTEDEEDIVPRKPPLRVAKGKSKDKPTTKPAKKRYVAPTVIPDPPKVVRLRKKAVKKPVEELPVDSSAELIPKLKTKGKQKETTTKQGPPLRTIGSVVSLSNSDSDGPPPLDYTVSQRYPPPTEERSVVWNGDQRSPTPSPLALREPKLSPAALDRLAQFDKEVLAEEEEEESQERAAVNNDPRKKLTEVALTQDKGKGRAQDPLFISHDEFPIYPPSPGASRAPSSIHQGAGNADDASAAVATEDVMFKPNPHSVLHQASPVKEKVSEDASVPRLQAATTTRNPSKKPVSTATTTTGPSNTNGRRKVHKAVSKSYLTDIVPETSAEESQSQSQEITLSSNPGIDLPVYASLQPPQPPSTPGGKNTLKSRMKGRTPSRAPSVSSDRENDTKVKPLRPVRMLSPSVFHPLLPVIPEPVSSLPESISEVVDDSFKQGSSKIHSDDIEQDGAMSSIEDFDSPEKAPRNARKPLKKDGVASTRNHKESATAIWESEVVQRGQQLAEAAKKSKKTPRPKKTLDEIRAGRGWSESNISRPGELVEKLGDSQGSVDKDDDAEMADASTAVVPPASGPRDLEEEDNSMTVEAMEEAYVDLHGGDEVVDPILLRHEEEESTQDLMMEFNAVHEHQRGMDLESGWNIEAVIEDHSISLSAKGKERAQDNDLDLDRAESISKIEMQGVEIIGPSPALQPLTEDIDPNDQAQPRSGSKAPLVSSGKPSSPPPNPMAPPDQSFNLVQADLDAVRSSLEVKLEEIASLQAQLASERAKNHVLQEEVLRLQPAIIHPNQLLDATNTDKERLAELEEQTLQFAVEKAEWEAERSNLQALLESTERGKVDAAKDRDFFREQYAQASGYVSSVRDENKDLEKRVKIAEEQASSGVALVKATFQTRIAELDKNVASWRMMAEFLVEKDKRTGNDDLRRRAAEQPELKRLCREQSDQLTLIQAELDIVKEELEERIEASTNTEAELDQVKTETVRLIVELNEALIKLERIGKAGSQDDSADMDATDGAANGHEFVYCCQWRWRNGEACQEVFSTISDLEQHLFSGGHLHRA